MEHQNQGVTPIDTLLELLENARKAEANAGILMQERDRLCHLRSERKRNAPILKISEGLSSWLVNNSYLYYFSTAVKLHKRIERVERGLPDDARPVELRSGSHIA